MSYQNQVNKLISINLFIYFIKLCWLNGGRGFENLKGNKMVTNIQHFFINKLYHINQVTFSIRVNRTCILIESSNIKFYQEEILHLDQRTIKQTKKVQLATMMQLLARRFRFVFHVFNKQLSKRDNTLRGRFSQRDDVENHMK